MFGQDRNALRRQFFQAWRKHRNDQALEPLEGLLVQVMLQHPEYHALLEDEEAHLMRDYTPEMGQSNPFLHLAMHVAIQEQLATDRPPGILEAYRAGLSARPDPHDVEHRMMECLAESLWQAQRQGTTPDEAAYLDCLRRQLGRKSR